MIKAVLFDFGGVLTETGKKGFITHIIAKLYDLEPKDLEFDGVYYLLLRGRGDEYAFFEGLNHRYKKKVSMVMYQQAIKDATKLSKEVCGLAEDLRKKHIRTGIVSNIFKTEALTAEQEGWYDGFSPVLLSCMEGYAKPDPQIYELAIKKLKLKPDEIAFIDNCEPWLYPAKTLGVHAILGTTSEQIIKDVKALIKRENNLEL